MQSWAHKLQQLIEQHQRVVLVTIVNLKGSTPRELGAKLLVTKEHSYHTIGGGNLEYQSIQLAQNLLNQAGEKTHQLKRFSLASSLGMCCGGIVEVLFEVINKQSSAWLNEWLEHEKNQRPALLLTAVQGDYRDKQVILYERVAEQTDQMIRHYSKAVFDTVLQLSESKESNYQAKLQYGENKQLTFIETAPTKQNHLILLGAGHIGQAVIQHFKQLPWQITWVDNRDDCLNQTDIDTLPKNIMFQVTDSPELEVALAPKNSYFLVMTHDHSLDLRLTESILKRNDFCYFGVIGSLTKRKRFEHRLKNKGFEEKQITQMICPVGISGIKSKQPYAIALSVVAQIVQIEELFNNNNKITMESKQTHVG